MMTYVDKDVSRLGSSQSGLWNTRVGTTDPQHGRRLPLGELGEELRLGGVDTCRPLLVTSKERGELSEGGHGSLVRGSWEGARRQYLERRASESTEDDFIHLATVWGIGGSAL